MPQFDPDQGTVLLTGEDPPRNDYLNPADGVNGSWRWDPWLYAWVGPAYEVSWTSGDEIPAFATTEPALRAQLYVGDWEVTSGGDTVIALKAPEEAASSDFGLIESTGEEYPSTLATASGTGSGVAFVIQYEEIPVVGVSAVNYAENPSFESGTTGYVGVNSATLSTSSTLGVVSGSTSMRVDPAAGHNSTGASKGTSPVALAGAGTGAYNVSAWVTTALSGVKARIDGVTWYSGASAGATGTANAFVNLTANVPTRISWSGSPSSGTPDGIVFNVLFATVSAANFSPGDYCYVDAVQVTQGATLLNYFDGDKADYATGTHAWTGTAHASTSTFTTVTPDPVPPHYPTTGPIDPGMDVLALLGSDVVVDGTFTFPPEDVIGDGDDGNYLIDLDDQVLYGPKAYGLWDTSIGLVSFKSDAEQTVTNRWTFDRQLGSSPGFLLGADTEPDDADVPLGQVAVWYDETAPSVSFVAAGAVTDDAGGDTTLSLPYPSGIQANDQLVLAFTVATAATPASQTGFTTVKAITRASSNEYVGIKTATGSESGTFATVVANASATGQILCFRNVDTTTPQDVAATEYNPGTSVTSFPLPTLTTTRTGVALVYIASSTTTTTYTAPTSPASFTETGDTVAGRSFTTGYLLWSGSGATGTVTVTPSGNGPALGVLLALRPKNGASINFKGHNTGGYVTGSLPLT